MLPTIGDRVGVSYEGTLFAAAVIRIHAAGAYDVVYEMDDSVGVNLTREEHILKLLPEKLELRCSTKGCTYTAQMQGLCCKHAEIHAQGLKLVPLFAEEEETGAGSACKIEPQSEYEENSATKKSGDSHSTKDEQPREPPPTHTPADLSSRKSGDSHSTKDEQPRTEGCARPAQAGIPEEPSVFNKAPVNECIMVLAGDNGVSSSILKSNNASMPARDTPAYTPGGGGGKKKVCYLAGCSNNVNTRGLCSAHCKKPCTAEGCAAKACARGLCYKHGADGKYYNVKHKDDGSSEADSLAMPPQKKMKMSRCPNSVVLTHIQDHRVLHFAAARMGAAFLKVPIDTFYARLRDGQPLASHPRHGDHTSAWIISGGTETKLPAKDTPPRQTAALEIDGLKPVQQATAITRTGRVSTSTTRYTHAMATVKRNQNRYLLSEAGRARTPTTPHTQSPATEPKATGKSPRIATGETLHTIRPLATFAVKAPCPPDIVIAATANHGQAIVRRNGYFTEWVLELGTKARNALYMSTALDFNGKLQLVKQARQHKQALAHKKFRTKKKCERQKEAGRKRDIKVPNSVEENLTRKAAKEKELLAVRRMLGPMPRGGQPTMALVERIASTILIQ